MYSDSLGDDFVVLNIKTNISSMSKEVLSPQFTSFFIINGWDADCGDPQNYPGLETCGEDNAHASQSCSRINRANAIVDDMGARCTAYADTEAFMIQHAPVIPRYINITWKLTHVNDYSRICAPYSTQNERFVNRETSVDGYTTEGGAAFEQACGSKQLAYSFLPLSNARRPPENRRPTRVYILCENVTLRVYARRAAAMRAERCSASAAMPSPERLLT